MKKTALLTKTKSGMDQQIGVVIEDPSVPLVGKEFPKVVLQTNENCERIFARVSSISFPLLIAITV